MNRTENYVIYSRPPSQMPRRAPANEQFVPENIRRYYLQLPFRSRKIESLARRIVAGAKTPPAQIRAVKDYLEKEYQYTTVGLPQDETDPLSVFLFERKAGHCQYFATAMAILLRHLEIPARVVNGFLQGEFNEIGGFYLVRHSDAHSWVEVYSEGAWTAYDPSPRVVPGEETSWFAWLRPRKLIESVAFFWDRYILIYSAQDQLEMLSSVREKYQEIQKNVKSRSKPIPGFMIQLKQAWNRYHRLLVSVLLCVLLLIYVGRIYFRRRRHVQVSRTPVLFYREMLSILERKGFRRTPQATPAEFVKNVSEEIAPNYVAELLFLTDLFYHSRFGNYPLTPSEQAKVRISLQRLQQL
jgi:hypothetical protein